MVCLIDVIVSFKPWRLSHAIQPVLFGASFGLFSLVYSLCGGTNVYYEPYIYPILNWQKPGRYNEILEYLSTS